MAEATGPLLSESARGSLNNGLINFQVRNGRTFVRQLHPHPKKKPTVKQLAVRQSMAVLVALWRNLHPADSLCWHRNSETLDGARSGWPSGAGSEGYYLFIGLNQHRHHHDEKPLFSPFSSATYTPPVVAFSSKTVST